MSFTWKDTTASDRKIFEAIRRLVRGNEELLEFLFCPERPTLRKRAAILTEDSWKFSSARRLLTRVALDFWSGSGHVFLWELLEEWNDDDWRHFLDAVHHLREADFPR